LPDIPLERAEERIAAVREGLTGLEEEQSGKPA
jgi:hypothetical protein